MIPGQIRCSVRSVVIVAVVVQMIAAFGVIAPLHSHADFSDHHDCQICLAAHQPGAESQPVMCAAPVPAVYAVWLPEFFLADQQIPSFFSPRAPPAADPVL